MRAALAAAAALLAAGTAAPPPAVTYERDGACVTCEGRCSEEKGRLMMGACGGAGAAWIPSTDPRGFPQIESAGSGGHCVNVDSARCAAGTTVWMHQCQPSDPSSTLHKGDHFAFNASDGTLRYVACDTAGDAGGAGWCLSSDAAELVACDAAAARGFAKAAFVAAPTPSPPSPAPPKKGAPNIVFFLTDDQDQMLGASFPVTAENGATPLPRTKQLMVDDGAVSHNFYIHTPICCPSRSETLTGRYLHNVKLPVVPDDQDAQCTEGYNGQDNAGNACCMHTDEKLVNGFTVGRYLSEGAGYTCGMFGKYLNVCPGVAQRGWDAWLANGGGSYFSPQFAVQNIDGVADGSHTFTDGYTTAVVGNYSIAWIKKVAKGDRPWMAYIAPKAAHEPFQPAKWYADYRGADWPTAAPRPPSWNMTKEQRAGHITHVANQKMITAEAQGCIEKTFVDRWRTLLSVDDVVAEVVATVESLGLKNSTYFMYSSDHGFQLGEMNLPMDKRNVYEFDIKIHLVMRGPGIRPGTVWEQPATNVDIAPTLLAIAGVPQPATMDGRSFLPFVVDAAAPALPDTVRAHLDARGPAAAAAWRKSVFVEYYYVGIGGKCGMSPIEGPDNNFIAVRHFGAGTGNVMYAEFQSGTKANVDFNNTFHYEMYDMNKDPWQIANVYNETKRSDPTLVAQLHDEVHSWLRCQGSSCP